MLEPIVKRCVGLDVHKMVVVATVLVEQQDGSIKEETKQFGTFRKHRLQMVRWLKSLDVELAVMESTGIYWKSVFASLEAAGITAYVVNARDVKKVPGRKTDVSDSKWLADLARVGLLNPSFIPPRDLRELRLITRHRVKLKGMLSAHSNRLHKCLDDAGIRLGGVVSDIRGVSARYIIRGLLEGKKPQELVAHVHGRLMEKIPDLLASIDEPLSERHKWLLSSIDRQITVLEQEIVDIDHYLAKEMLAYKKQIELLQTIPGVDFIAAVMLLVETGPEMKCFGNAHRLASWAGMCPGNNESAGKKKSGRTRKGNATVRKVLCEIANAAAKTNSQFKGQYQGLVIRRGHKRAIVAVGHKVLRVVYALLKSLKPYMDPAIDYSQLVVKRNAPRWLSALKKYGYLPELAKAV